MKVKGTDGLYHYVYKVTSPSGKYYYGKHSTNKYPDTYWGSGTAFNMALKKYGKLNMKKEVLFWCRDEETAYDVEAHIVTQAKVDDPMCYNLQRGGRGDPSQIGHKTRFKKGQVSPNKNKKRKRMNKDGQNVCVETHLVDEYLEAGWSLGFVTALTKWITKDGVDRKCLVDKLSKYISDGWTLGRSKMKGRVSPNKGKPATPETIARISKRGTCPHCGYEGQWMGMQRYHYNKCKHKET